MVVLERRYRVHSARRGGRAAHDAEPPEWLWAGSVPADDCVGGFRGSGITGSEERAGDLTMNSAGKITGTVKSTVANGTYSVGISLHDNAAQTHNTATATLKIIVNGHAVVPVAAR